MSYLRKITIFAVLVLIVGTLSGCNTLADARMAKGKGDFRVYNVAAEKLWNAMPDAIKSVGLAYVGENRQEGYVLAQRSITAWSFGEDVAIFITSLEDQKTRVEIVSKKALATNVFAPNWVVKLFKALDALFIPTSETQ